MDSRLKLLMRFTLGEADSVSSNDAFPYSAEMVKVLSSNDRELLSKGVHVDSRYRVDSNTAVSPSGLIDLKASDFIESIPGEDDANTPLNPGPNDPQRTSVADYSLSKL